MKKIEIEFLKVFIMVLAAVFVFAGCSTQKIEKKKNTRASDVAMKCCPDEGGGILPAPLNDNREDTKDYGAFVVFGGEYDVMYFTSSRAVENKKPTYRPAEVFYSTRPASKRGMCPNEGWSEPKRLSCPGTDLEEYTKGTTVIYENRIIFSAEREISSGTEGTSYNLDLWEAIIESDGNISNPQQIPNVNMDDYWETQPALSSDGATLFFVSNRPLPGTEGRTDKNIWYSRRIGGQWQTPMPINEINTKGDEVTPFVDKDGKFYYSSNWNREADAESATGFDIYISTEFYVESEIYLPKNPKNLNDYFAESEYNLKFNTEASEMFPYVTPDGLNFYFTSERNGGYGSLDIYGCKLPEPKVFLIVDVFEQVITPSGEIMTEKDANHSIKLLITDNFGKTIRPEPSSGDKVQLKPNTTYTVKAILGKEDCLTCVAGNPAEVVVEVGAPKNNTVIRKELSIECRFETDTIGITHSNFITGYWFPMTRDNYNNYVSRVGNGFFRNSQYVDTVFAVSGNAVEKIMDTEKNFKVIYDKLDNLIKQYKDCLEKYQNLGLRISLIGYTDSRRLRPGIYPDETFNIRNDQIANGIQMSDNQGGNIYLSKLRAKFAQVTIDKDMAKRNKDYVELRDKGIITFDFEGYGIHPKYKPGDDPESRRVDIFVDIGPKSYLANLERVQEGKLYFRTIPGMKGGAEIVEVDPDPLKADVLNIKQVESDCFRVEYYLYNSDRASFLEVLLNEFTDLDFVKLASGDNPTLFTVSSKCFSTRMEAIEKSIQARNITNEISVFLRKMWPQLENSCEVFAISFGVHNTRPRAEELARKIKSAGIEDVVIEEIATDNENIVYRVRTGKYTESREANIAAKEYSKLMRKADIYAFVKIFKEIVPLGSN
jgi:hypothetical protein